MSLIMCPECGEKVSDTAKLCPHCGYNLTHHKANERKKVIAQRIQRTLNRKVMIGIVSVCFVVGVICYITIIEPNQIYKKAISSLEYGDYLEANKLLNKISSSASIISLIVPPSKSLRASWISSAVSISYSSRRW